MIVLNLIADFILFLLATCLVLIALPVVSFLLTIYLIIGASYQLITYKLKQLK